jgi:hypothetical protein
MEGATWSARKAMQESEKMNTRSEYLINECMTRVNDGEVTEDDIVKLLEWVLVRYSLSNRKQLN